MEEQDKSGRTQEEEEEDIDRSILSCVFSRVSYQRDSRCVAVLVLIVVFVPTSF